MRTTTSILCNIGNNLQVFFFFCLHFRVDLYRRCRKQPCRSIDDNHYNQTAHLKIGYSVPGRGGYSMDLYTKLQFFKRLVSKYFFEYLHLPARILKGLRKEVKNLFNVYLYYEYRFIIYRYPIQLINIMKNS